MPQNICVSNKHREYLPDASYSVFQFEASDDVCCLQKLNRVQFCVL